MDVLEEAKERAKIARDGWDRIYRKADEDLHFLSDEQYAQCDAEDAAGRAKLNRPVIEIDQLTQYVHQVSNDIRMNTPTIKVIPAGDGSDVETAEMIEGRVKAIEYKSNADAAYDMAADFSIKSSIGYIRVDHGYVSKKGFEQELQIKRVVNPRSIMIDPDSIEPDGSDAMWGFVFEQITRKKFQKKYPKATAVSFGEELPYDKDVEEDYITIAEYFYIEEDEEEVGLLEGGETEPRREEATYKQTRKVKKRAVMRCWVGGEDLLTEPSKFPGEYIPLVPVYGEEAWIDGKRNLLSLIRKAKSPARMYNALKSSEVEILLKQQQAPVQAAVGQMRGFENDWKNPEKAMVLYYHQTDVMGVAAPPPQRLNPPVVSSGYAAASMDAENNIKKSLGMYSAAVGKREGDSSGKALVQLEQSSDLATMHFGDNLTRSVTHVGKIIVCALPEVEDTERVVQIIGKEDEVKQIGINGAMTEGQKRTYDFGKGDWDVRVVTGPSFTTQRQEAAAFYQETVKILPPEVAVNLLDLVFKYSDAPGAQAASARLKKMVDPKFLDENERPKPEDGQPNPEVQQLTAEATQVMQVAQQEIQQLQEQLAKMEQEKQTDEAETAQQAVKNEIASLKQQQRIAELEIDGQRKDFEIEVIQAKQELTPQEPEQPQGMQLPQGLQITKSPEHLAMEDSHKQAEFEQEQQEMQMRAAQTQSIIEAVSGVQTMLGALVQAVNKPKNIVFNPDGTPTGIR